MAATKPTGKKAPARKVAKPGAAAEAPRALTASPERDKEVPTPRLLHHERESVTLEEVLVNFQRSLARATRSSLETARSDLQVGLGQRALYVIDGIDVKLQAGVVMARDAAGSIQAVSVDLGADPAGPGQAELSFRIGSRPIEPIASEQIVLADLDPLGLQRPSHRMRITLIGRRLASEPAVSAPEHPAPQALRPATDLESVGAKATAEPQRVLSPLPGRDLHLYLVGTTTGATEIFILRTNAVGQADVEIDALGNRVTSGDLGGRFRKLDLTRKDSEFFAWATCKPGQADGVTTDLISNVLQFTVKRDTSAGADK